MKRLKRILCILAVWLFFAIVSMVMAILLVGAIRFASAIVTETIPTSLEIAGMIFVMLMGGAIGAFLYANDTGDDE